MSQTPLCLSVLLTLLLASIPSSRAFPGDEAPVTSSVRENGNSEELPRQAATTISKLQWRLGAIARDQQHDPIKAAHYFYQAARSARRAKQEKRAQDILLAAQNAADSVKHTFLHNGAVSGAAFSPDGQIVLTWSGTGSLPDETARLWSAGDGGLVRTLDLDARIQGAVFSPNGRRLFLWGHRPTPNGEGNLAWLFDVTKDEPLRKFEDRFGQIEDAVFTADSSAFFVWSNERRTWAPDRKGHLWLWDIEEGKSVLSKQNNVVTPDRHNERGPLIIHAPRPPIKNKDDFEAWRDDVEQKKQLVRSLPNARVNGATFSPDNRLVVTWNRWTDTAHLWDVKNKKHFESLSHPQARIIGAAFNSDATRLLIWNDLGGNPGSCHFRLWNLAGYRPSPLFTIRYKKEINRAAFAPDGHHILVCSDDGTARLWNTRPPELLRLIPLKQRIGGAVLNADASRVFAWDVPDSHVWDLESGKRLQIFEHAKFRGKLGGGDSNPQGTRFLTWSANNTLGDEVELTHDRGFVWLWQVGRNKPIHTLRHDGWVTAARFNADGTRVLSASEDNTARLWDVKSGKLLQTFRHEGDVGGGVFGPDESRILSWGGLFADSSEQDSTVRLWEAKTGKLLHKVSHPKTYPNLSAAKLNADGTRILSWDRDEARIWELDSDQPLITFSRKAAGILPVTFRIDTPWIVVKEQENEKRAASLRKHFKSVKKLQVPLSPPPESRRLVIHPKLNRACALYYSDTAELFSPRLDQPIGKLWPAGREGAHFNPEANRLLTWGDGLQFWNIAIKDRGTIQSRHRDHTTRSATRLDDLGRIRVLSFEERQKRIGQRNAE